MARNDSPKREVPMRKGYEFKRPPDKLAEPQKPPVPPKRERLKKNDLK